MQNMPSAIHLRTRQWISTASRSSALSSPPALSMCRSCVKSCWTSSTSMTRVSSTVQVADDSVGFRPSGSKSTTFLAIANVAFSPTSICITAAAQAGEVWGSPRTSAIELSSCSGYTFFSSFASSLTKTRCLFDDLPSIHSLLGVHSLYPGASVSFLTTSFSPTVGLTTSFFGFFGLGGSSFLIIIGGLSACRFSALADSASASSSNWAPSLGSAMITAPSFTLLGSPLIGLMSSSSRPSHVNRICFGGTLRLYFRFSFRWPGVELGSTGTFTSPDGSTTFSCIVGVCGQAPEASTQR
mmetsp:Transcript_52368/g.147482  ORF Transcript_52368/g.147482 Transcript_52368/m.147482 type:complete len:298 (-) Transcript_52368:28-921(-)